MGATDTPESLKGRVNAAFSRRLRSYWGRSGSLCKILWHDGLGMSLYSKRLEKGRFVWPAAKDGTVAISASAMACLLEGIDWRNPQETWRPTQVG
ncbi:MAG: IS66 family insertion sequence element accessory protein TnpB [Sphingobium sp.]